jgi:hypothetical protein
VSDVFTVAPEELPPDRDAVLAQLGIPAGTELSDRIERLYAHAIGVFAVTVAPAGVIEEIPREGFEAVYRGEGKNAPGTPVALIAPRAEHLALFAVTLGEPLSRAVAECFAGTDFALGYTLDAMASVAADAAACLAERRYAQSLRDRGWATPDGAVLRYSPGYCGWDITGQRRLFAALRPEPIGLTLTDSCLMQPLKSVSGVLIAGPRTIHRFPPTYDFCARCAERTCRDRLAALFGGAAQ